MNTSRYAALAGSSNLGWRYGVLAERLEARRLLATIEGNVWNDTDNDGLRDFFENGVEGVVVYLDDNQNRQLEDGERTTTTDSKGNYRFDDLEVAEGGSTYFVHHLPTAPGVTGLMAQTAPGISGRTNVQSAFDIEIVYADNTLSDDQKTLVETAVNRWEQIIRGDLPDVGPIDDLRITVVGSAVDGPGGVLAFAGPTSLRDPVPGFPALALTGEVTLDLVDSVASRGFIDVVVHEIGHITGIGTIWDQFLINRGNASVSYIGDNGVEEYSRLFGQSFPSVPVQPEVEGHWNDAFLPNELMNPFSAGGFELPPDADPLLRFSRLTAGAMEDFGYEVSYAGVDTYGPFDIGPLPEDFLPELGFVPFEIGVFLETPDTVVDDANFGVRENSGPAPFFFVAGPVIQAVGQPVRLLAEVDTTTESDFPGDLDFRDQLIQINFYRESNGTPGLQTGEGGDTLLSEDADRTDGFEVDAETAGLSEGEHIFYARGYDEGYFTTDRALIVNLVSGQTTPAKPLTVQALAEDTDTIVVSWLDASDNENGFLLQVSRSADFDITADITNIYLPPGEGTGPVTFRHEVPEGELTTRHYRVRSFNTGGSSPFAGRATARTLSPGEVLVDDEGEIVTLQGDWEQIVDRQRAVNLTYLRGTTGFAQYDPNLSSAQAGRYSVFFRNTNTGEAGVVAVEVFGEDEELLGTLTVDQNATGDGASVLVGNFDLDENSFVRVRPISGVGRVDTVRFLRAG